MTDELKLNLKSMSISDEKKAQLKQLFPEVFTESKIDLERLKQVLGENIETGKERYGMTWAGKSNCFKIIQEPSVGTLKPCKAESVNFDKTENVFIQGDNLEVLKLLQKSYYGKIKMIYIDPPYNTGNEFIYPDNFSETLDTYLKYTGQKNAEGKKFSTNVETEGRFHSKWMNMIYTRLYLARNLLLDDGFICISIDDNELFNLKMICDEVFGVDNFMECLVWRSGRTSASVFTREHEYILIYARNKELIPLIKYEGVNQIISDRCIKKISQKNPACVVSFSKGIEFDSEDKVFPLEFGDSEKVKIVKGVLECKNRKLANDVTVEAGWTMRDQIKTWLAGEDVLDTKGQKVTKFYFAQNGVLRYEKEKGTEHPKTIIEGLSTKAGSSEVSSLFDNELVFDYPKPVGLIKLLLKLTQDEDIILDFFAGSGTVGHAVHLANSENGGKRKFICIQLPEETKNKDYPTVADICRERIKKAASKILAENTNLKTDLGLKVLKLSQSNFKTWETGHDQDVAGSLKLYADHIDHNANSEDILYEILLKSGFELTTRIDSIIVEEKEIFSIEDGAMFVYLGDGITKELTYKIAEKTPSRFVCLDHSFHHNDQLKTNTVQLMKSRNIEFRTV